MPAVSGAPQCRLAPSFQDAAEARLAEAPAARLPLASRADEGAAPAAAGNGPHAGMKGAGGDQPGRDRPAVLEVSYAQLRSGHVQLGRRQVPTASLSSLRRAREIAALLKEWVTGARFLLTEPVAPLPARQALHALEVTPPMPEEPGGAGTWGGAVSDGMPAAMNLS